MAPDTPAVVTSEMGPLFLQKSDPSGSLTAFTDKNSLPHFRSLYSWIVHKQNRGPHNGSVRKTQLVVEALLLI